MVIMSENQNGALSMTCPTVRLRWKNKTCMTMSHNYTTYLFHILLWRPLSFWLITIALLSFFTTTVTIKSYFLLSSPSIAGMSNLMMVVDSSNKQASELLRKKGKGYVPRNWKTKIFNLG